MGSGIRCLLTLFHYRRQLLVRHRFEVVIIGRLLREHRPIGAAAASAEIFWACMIPEKLRSIKAVMHCGTLVVLDNELIFVTKAEKRGSTFFNYSPLERLGCKSEVNPSKASLITDKKSH